MYPHEVLGVQKYEPFPVGIQVFVLAENEKSLLDEKIHTSIPWPDGLTDGCFAVGSVFVLIMTIVTITNAKTSLTLIKCIFDRVSGFL